MRSDGEQAGQQGHKGGTDEGNTAAGHELLHALAFRAGVVRTIPFQQVDAAPHAEAGTQGNNEGLKEIGRASCRERV